jgi:WD40 repeat protein
MSALLALGLVLVVFAAPAWSQPDSAKPKTDAHVDHEGFPLPAEAIGRVGSARMRTAVYIASLGYSPDGKTIASATGDGILQFWDAATGELRQ